MFIHGSINTKNWWKIMLRQVLTATCFSSVLTKYAQFCEQLLYGIISDILLIFVWIKSSLKGLRDRGKGFYIDEPISIHQVSPSDQIDVGCHTHSVRHCAFPLSEQFKVLTIGSFVLIYFNSIAACNCKINLICWQTWNSFNSTDNS